MKRQWLRRSVLLGAIASLGLTRLAMAGLYTPGGLESIALETAQNHYRRPLAVGLA